MNINELKEIVNDIVKNVNLLTQAEVNKEIKNYIFIQKKQREGLPELEWIKPGILIYTRFAPNPSGFLHIGHAKTAILCDEYVKKYGGKFFVRFEDTDPKIKKPILEAYDAIIDDLKWLKCNIAAIIRQSDRLDLYYSYAKKLIAEEKAYVCTCEYNVMQNNRNNGQSCACAIVDVTTNLKKWEMMFTEYNGKEAVLRIKTDLNHPNISVRDWIMFRIINEEHPILKNKYRVWPLYNFAAVIDDHEMGINLVIRGKEHEINMVKQSYLYKAFNWTQPHTIEIGVLKIHGELVHKSDIIKAIKEGKLTGWDDPRAPTIKGFRNKGIHPETIREYIVNSGIGKNDSFLNIEKLEAINKKYPS